MNESYYFKPHVPGRTVRIAIIILFFLLIIILGKYHRVNPDDLKELLAGGSVFRISLLFVFLYVIVTFFIWLSKDVFRFIAAVVFGPLLSTLLVFLAETINAAILFSLSRYLGKGFVDGLLKTKGGSRNLKRTISRASLGTLFTLRVVPLVPFRMLDLASGLTRIRLSQYLMIVVLASPARIFWLQYILAGLGEAAFKNPQLIISYLIDNKLAFVWSLVYLVLAIILAFKIKQRV